MEGNTLTFGNHIYDFLEYYLCIRRPVDQQLTFGEYVFDFFYRFFSSPQNLPENIDSSKPRLSCEKNTVFEYYLCIRKPIAGRPRMFGERIYEFLEYYLCIRRPVTDKPVT